MSKQLSHVITNRLNMQPALIAPMYAELISDSIRQMYMADHGDEDDQEVRARRNLLASYGYNYVPSGEEKPFAYANGIAFIPVSGLLINRFSRSWGWVTGYNYIREMLNAALVDPDVKSIVFDCNSGGGEVSGCFELCAEIRASREVKPSLAVVDSAAYSACYAVASSASKMVVTPSGGVGSIGVVAMHIDYSKWLSEVGIKVTFIYSGDHKVDGNAYEPLPEPVRKSIQGRVDAIRTEFVSLVSENRGIDTQVVFDTQAKCFTASEGLDLGLVDAITTPIEAVRAFVSELSGSVTIQEKTEMNEAETKSGDANPNPTASATTVDAAAVKAAERERIKAITGHESAKDKQVLANHLALNTELSVEQAAQILAAAAPEGKQEEAAADNAFVAAMNSDKHPNVGSGDAAENMTDAQKILAAQSMATGVKF